MPDQAGLLARQLAEPARVLDARPRPAGGETGAAGRGTGTSGGDPRPGRGYPGPGPGGRPVPGVVLLSRSCDAEASLLARLLGRAGITVMRANADQLEPPGLLIDPDEGTVSAEGGPLLPTVTVVRHFSARAMPDAGGPAPSMYRRDSWRAAVSGLAAIARTSIGAERPGLLAQLRLAREHQVAVPRTIVTTDPARAAGTFGCRRLIIKAMHRHFVEAAPGRLSGVFPVVADRVAVAGEPCPGPPVVVQEYLEHDAELRVYVVDGQVLAFDVGKRSPAGLWTEAGQVSVTRIAPPPGLARAARSLAAAMSLRYGAFDFLIRDGTPYFLEVNPDGDWRWAERGAGGMPVTLAVAGMIVRLHRRAAGSGSGGFDLLAFLTG